MGVDVRTEVSVAERAALLEAALGFARECRAAVRAIVACGMQIDVKPDYTLVTNADIRAEEVFRRSVQARFPHAGVIGEELGASDPQAAYQWIIDPIDGTAEFANGIPLYGTIIALHYRGQPLIGVLDHPALDLVCAGGFGLGVKVNGRSVRIDPSAVRADGKERITTPSRSSYVRYADEGHRFDALARAHPNFRVFHTCYAHVCAITGGVDAAIEWKAKLWDLAATRVLVEEAGGTYRLLEEIEQPGGGTLYSAVFGKPELVAGIARLLSS